MAVANYSKTNRDSELCALTHPKLIESDSIRTRVDGNRSYILSGPHSLLLSLAYLCTDTVLLLVVASKHLLLPGNQATPVSQIQLYMMSVSTTPHILTHSHSFANTHITCWPSLHYLTPVLISADFLITSLYCNGSLLRWRYMLDSQVRVKSCCTSAYERLPCRP